MPGPIRANARKPTPPSATYMSSDQFAKYLSDLRTSRITRPGGARPQPIQSTGTDRGRDASVSSNEPANPYEARPVPKRGPSIGALSITSRQSSSQASGRDYYPTVPTAPLKLSEVVPTARYIERGQRWMEKEEAVSLRDAMEEMEIRESLKNQSEDEEARLFQAARNEAAELVWQHQRGNSQSSTANGPYRYRPHLRKSSYAHARTASVGSTGDDVAPNGLGRDYIVGSPYPGFNGTTPISQPPRTPIAAYPSGSEHLRKMKSYNGTGMGSRRTGLKRNISGEIGRPFTEDQIWEEPQAQATTDPAAPGRASPNKLGSKSQNPTGRFPEQKVSTKSVDRVEIHRNLPTQSRNAQYTTNPTSPPTLPQASIETKNGIEVRSKAIRDATGRKLKDRSSNLPEPTAVSDTPGRPIVNFEANWKAPGDSTDNPSAQSWHHDEGQTKHGTLEEAHASLGQAQGISAPESASRFSMSLGSAEAKNNVVGTPSPNKEIPAIQIPVITVETAPDVSVPKVVLPGSQCLERHARSLSDPETRNPQKPRSILPTGKHWSPAAKNLTRATASCYECGLPIEGRFVALAGSPERFHPQCFRCFTCGTSLEAMEISPEPDQVRSQRLERIRRCAAGETLEESPGESIADDGDERLRFYCHLDWHELFAPRCRHCKTPILGEHIFALGAHWHQGHFFCAECGDPFTHDMTHIEKDGFAWCINCQTKRTERRAPKCEKCKTAVIGQYIQALGGEWHETCFRCAECQGGFDDGQIFPKETQEGMMVLCTACRSRELKA